MNRDAPEWIGWLGGVGDWSGRCGKARRLMHFGALGRKRNGLWATRGEHSKEANALQGVENGWAE